MIALIQRVLSADVSIAGAREANISQGIMALIAIEQTDQSEQLAKMCHKLLNYRIFADSNEKMNCSLLDIKGGLLLVPQFTLAADTKKGLRPSFSKAASPDIAQQYFEQFVKLCQSTYSKVQAGIFGADMQVSLVNDGPVTFYLQV